MFLTQSFCSCGSFGPEPALFPVICIACSLSFCKSLLKCNLIDPFRTTLNFISELPVRNLVAAEQEKYFLGKLYKDKAVLYQKPFFFGCSRRLTNSSTSFCPLHAHLTKMLKTSSKTLTERLSEDIPRQCCKSSL